MDLFWQINWEEMLSALIGTTFVILLPVSIVVVSSMVMSPLIDVAFKAKPAPKDTRERSTDFLRPDARLVDVNYWLKLLNVERYGNYDPPLSTKPRKTAPKLQSRKVPKPALLTGGNPQIAKADGDAPVRAYIAAMPGWKRDVERRLDALRFSSLVPRL